ncbi:MAG TPA: hypothetical protein VD928_02535, partial [Candidatus Paceibacterota bacterium]|nr:hypothetical protein [Candidatus Paceibacterota bacterium]
HIEKIGLFLFFEEIKLIPGLLFFMSWSFVRATRIWEYAAIPLGFLYGFITILLIVEFSKHL